MDEEGTDTIEIRHYLTLLARWLWLIILGAVLAGGSTFAVSWFSTPVYEASTTLLINEGQKGAGLDYNAILLSERVAKTYSQLLKSGPVLEEAAAQLGFGLEAKDIVVELVRDTQLICLRARHADPERAAAIANTVPVVFIAQNSRTQSARFASLEESLKSEIAAAEAQVEASQRALDAERNKPQPDAATVAHLETVLAQQRASYTGLARSYDELRVAAVRAVDTVVVVEPARVPVQPILPRTASNTALGAIVGAMLAAGAAFLIEYLDDTIKTPRDVERATQLPTMASIVRFEFAPNGEGPLIAAQPSSAISEGYRVLRTNLQFSMLGGQGEGAILMVTSAEPTEGKTTTLANLGVSLAQIGKRVLLVDTDLRHPTLHQQFGLPNRVGFTTLFLEQGINPQRVAHETGIPGLQVLTAGPIPANPAEVLDFPTTPALLDRLRPLADYVLLDSPPVLSMADASILAQKVDGVVLVAEAGRVRTDAFCEMVGALRSVKARLLGVVLNRVKTQPGRYYAHYAYGNGSEQRRKRRKRRE